MTATYELIGSNCDRIAFDGVEFGVSRDNLEGMSGYPIDVDYQHLPGQVGSYHDSIDIIERVITMRIAVFGLGRVALEGKRKRLIRALNPLNGKSTLIWHKANGESVYIQVYPDKDSPNFGQGTAPEATIWEGDLDLVAEDPCWYRLQDTVLYPLRGYEGGFSVPFSLPLSFGTISTSVTIDNPGDIPSGCTIQIHGMMVNPVISNLTTGESISIKRTIATGEILTITTGDDAQSAALTSADGTVTNALHYVSIESDFWHIWPGTNTLQILAADADAAAVAYVSYIPRDPAQ